VEAALADARLGASLTLRICDGNTADADEVLHIPVKYTADLLV
jgi:hypothetical protein